MGLDGEVRCTEREPNLAASFDHGRDGALDLGTIAHVDHLKTAHALNLEIPRSRRAPVLVTQISRVGDQAAGERTGRAG